VWGLFDTTQRIDGETVDVLVVGRSARGLTGVCVHRSRTVPPRDVRWCKGIPVTSPALTVLRLAAEMDDLELESVLSVALKRNLIRRSQLRDVMKRNPKAKGIATLRRLLESTESLHDTRSLYERKLLKLLRAAELPLPITNTWVAGEFVDGVWSDIKLVFEFDGWKYHGGRRKFETDRLRDQHLTTAGHQIMRITARQIDHRPYALVARIAGVIARLRLTAGAEARRSA
jgi:very-short-patch-repair endonuclease